MNGLIEEAGMSRVRSGRRAMLSRERSQRTRRRPQGKRVERGASEAEARTGKAFFVLETTTLLYYLCGMGRQRGRKSLDEAAGEDRRAISFEGNGQWEMDKAGGQTRQITDDNGDCVNL